MRTGPYRSPSRGIGHGDLPERRYHYMTQLIALISSFRRDEGQGLAEYALILALIAIVAIVALIFLGGQVSTILSTVGDSI
jgi:pilus assembly protein Flp/PilA